MNSNRHIDPEDLVLFALQFLTPEQNEAVRVHLEQCDGCQNEFASANGDLAIFASTAEMHSPPAQARDRLMQAVAREPRQRAAGSGEFQSALKPLPLDPIDPIDRQTRDAGRASLPRAAEPVAARSGLHLVSRSLPWLGWAVAAGLTFAVTGILHDRDGLRNEVVAVNHQIAQVSERSSEARRLFDTLNDPSAQRVTLTLSKAAALPQAKATYVPAKGALVFVASNMAPLAPAKTYELWLIPTGGGAPIAAGSFQPDAGGTANLLLPKLPPGVTAKAFGITIEEQGAAMNTPTMPIIMAGAAGL